MTIRERVIQSVGTLSEPELSLVAKLIAVVKARPETAASLDPASYGALYREFAEEDRQLAEQGMGDYCHQLRVLDSSRLIQLTGTLEAHLLLQVENAVLFTLGIGSETPDSPG